MKLYKTASLLFLVFFCLQLNAQTEAIKPTDNLSLDGGTIDSQFEYLTKKSSGWTDLRGQKYEVVRINWIAKLKKNTLDTLKAINKNLNGIKSIVANQEQEILKLKTSLNTTQGSLDKTNTEKNSIALFGLQMSKDFYNGLIWLIIGVLLFLLLLFIYKFKNSNLVTRQAKESLIETEEEFEDHRRIALEREQKVRRQLQDEINKQKTN